MRPGPVIARAVFRGLIPMGSDDLFFTPAQAVIIRRKCRLMHPPRH